MLLDEIDFSEEEISHAIEPVEADEPWDEADEIG
jgi:hypothetical protein